MPRAFRVSASQRHGRAILAACRSRGDTLSAVMAGHRVRAAIIGTGFMGRVHCEALRRLGVVDVAAVAGSSLDKAREFAAAFGVDRAEADYRAVLADPAIDAVLQPALLPDGAADARDARGRRARRDSRRAGHLLAGLAALRHRLELARRGEARRPAPRDGRHRLALVRHGRTRVRASGLARSAWISRPSTRRARARPWTPKTSAPCCFISARAPAERSPSARCRRDARTGSRWKSTAPVRR